MLNWYAIYTKPKCEDSTALHLRNAGIKVLNPKIRIKKYLRGKYLQAVEPLFKNYIFAEFDNTTHNQMIRFTRGVKYIVGKENPVAVPKEIIEAINAHMGEDSIITPARESFSRGDRVLVKEGPFANFYGIFERELPGRERIVILLEALGSRLEIEDVSVRKA
jgi:transcriptional antiterminator RfaH